MARNTLKSVVEIVFCECDPGFAPKMDAVVELTSHCISSHVKYVLRLQGRSFLKVNVQRLKLNPRAKISIDILSINCHLRKKKKSTFPLTENKERRQQR